MQEKGDSGDSSDRPPRPPRCSACQGSSITSSVASVASKDRGAETAQEARNQVIVTRSTSLADSDATYNRPGRISPGFRRGTVATALSARKPSQKVDPFSGSGHCAPARRGLRSCSMVQTQAPGIVRRENPTIGVSGICIMVLIPAIGVALSGRVLRWSPPAAPAWKSSPPWPSPGSVELLAAAAVPRPCMGMSRTRQACKESSF
jgi:hypothetical protein